MLVAYAGSRGFDEVYVTTSGNMTVERALASTVPTLHSNDVTIYPCTLGWYLAGEKLPYRLTEEMASLLPWIEPYLDDGVGTAATVMIGSSQPSVFRAAKADSAYYKRMLRGIERQFPQLHEKTVAKLEALTLRIESFHPIDAVDYVAEVPDGKPVISFPPFFGSSDYVSQFKPIEEAFEWPEPSFEDLSKERYDLLLDMVADRPAWLFASDQRIERFEPNLSGIVQTSNRGLPVYIYAPKADRRLVRPHQALEVVPNRRLAPDEDLGEHIGLATLSLGQFATLRSQYMSHKIRPGVPYMAMAILVDGAVIGSFAIGPSNHHPQTAYMLSDFPIAPSKYDRLSKLIVMAACSRESRMLLQRRCGTEMTRVRTTAFTNNPVSMKYGRGVKVGPHKMILEKRDDPPAEEPFKYMLNYVAPYGEWTLQEALDEWRKKHGKHQSAPKMKARA